MKCNGRGCFETSDSQESEFSFGHREVSKISMLPEVLRALKGRFSAVNEVVYAQRFARTTIVPAIVLKDDSEAAEKWFKLHHAPTKDVGLRILHLESIEGEPVFVEGLDGRLGGVSQAEFSPGPRGHSVSCFNGNSNQYIQTNRFVGGGY